MGVCLRHHYRYTIDTGGSIHTAFVKRLNLTLRPSLAAVTRRSLTFAKTKRHLQFHLNAYLVYSNLVRIAKSKRAFRRV
jgi:IS1 family transposase